ncbi:hypothetical protein HYW74_02330 [Candidatus Pacearchaeota archaeon]|nr:hypothetical protein [Candidatus Pacearchaeota archaeon]
MEGVTRKFLISPRTVDDPMVKDGLEAVSLLNETEPYYLVGGIATQSYLPTRCRRETSDIDLCLVKPLSYHTFKDMISPLEGFLQDKGYSVDTRKGSRAFSLNFISPDHRSLTIEAPKRNINNIEKHRRRLEREFENSRTKIIEGRDGSYRVTAPEDIAVPKLVRVMNTLVRSPYLGGSLPVELEPLSDEDIERKLYKISELRAEAMHNPGDIQLAERVRFVSDLYDIRILSELTGFNEAYWREAEKDWDSIGNEPKIRNRVLRVMLPTFKEVPIDTREPSTSKGNGSVFPASILI